MDVCVGKPQRSQVKSCASILSLAAGLFAQPATFTGDATLKAHSPQIHFGARLPAIPPLVEIRSPLTPLPFGWLGSVVVRPQVMDCATYRPMGESAL